MTIKKVIALLTLTIATTQGHAMNLTSTDNQISKVTVYTQGAMVTRNIVVDVPQGEHQLTLSDLPANVDPNSIRVETVSALSIGSVDSRWVNKVEYKDAELNQLNDQLQQLLDQDEAFKDQLESIDIQLSFIKKLGDANSAQISKQLAHGINSDEWQKAWQSLGSGTAQLLDNQRQVNIQRRELEKGINQKRYDIQLLGQRHKSHLDVVIKLEAHSAETQAGLKLIYQISGASWHPLYDARLTVDSRELELSQLAQVRQQTGEDWHDIQLILSTSQPGQGTSFDEAEPWFIGVAQQTSFGKVAPSRLDKSAVMNRMEQDFDVSMTEMQAAPVAAEPSPTGMTNTTAAIGEFSVDHKIPGLISLNSGDGEKKFSVDTLKFDAELVVRAMPKREEKAYLFAKTTYGGQYPLLAGEVALFRDGTYVGKGELPLLRPQERLKLGFGEDLQVRIKRQITDNKQDRGGLFGGKKRDIRGYLTKITNFHKQAIQVTILDQLPVSTDGQIDVEMLDSTSKPSKVDLNEVKGLMAWTAEYQSQEEAEIHFEYRVIYPANIQLHNF